MDLICTNCKNEIEYDWLYCPYCGDYLPGQQEESTYDEDE